MVGFNFYLGSSADKRLPTEYLCVPVEGPYIIIDFG